MIVRNQHKETALCISQVHHSAMTGELARLWNEAFMPLPSNVADIVLAAGLHDIGWQDWEENPPLNPETGHPYDFLQMPKFDHLDIWQKGYIHTHPFGRLISLLVFRHNTYLAEQQPIEGLSSEKQKAYQVFFQTSKALKNDLIASLRKHDGLNPTDNELNLMNSFILFWDYLSLRMCMGAERNPFGLPPELNHVKFELIPGKLEEEFILDPWPFNTHEIIWNCEVTYHKKGSDYNSKPGEKYIIPLYLRQKM